MHCLQIQMVSGITEKKEDSCSKTSFAGWKNKEGASVAVPSKSTETQKFAFRTNTSNKRQHNIIALDSGPVERTQDAHVARHIPMGILRRQ